MGLLLVSMVMVGYDVTITCYYGNDGYDVTYGNCYHGDDGYDVACGNSTL